jgi:hypothetical protein
MSCSTSPHPSRASYLLLAHQRDAHVRMQWKDKTLADEANFLWFDDRESDDGLD